MNRNFRNTESVKNNIEKSIIGDFNLQQFENIFSDLEKSKYYREIKVTRDGKTFIRRQLVGSEDENTRSKHMSYNDIKSIPQIYNHVDKLIKDVVWHEPTQKFYTVEKRTPSAKPVLFEYNLSPVDKRIKMEGEDMTGSPWKVKGVKEANEEMLEKVNKALARLKKYSDKFNVEFKIPVRLGPHQAFLEKQPKTLDQANENRLDKQTREANEWLNEALSKKGKFVNRTSLLSNLMLIVHNNSEITRDTKIDYDVEGIKGNTTLGKLMDKLSEKIKKDEEGGFKFGVGVIGNTKITILKDKENG